MSEDFLENTFRGDEDPSKERATFPGCRNTPALEECVHIAKPQMSPAEWKQIKELIHRLSDGYRISYEELMEVTKKWLTG